MGCVALLLFLILLSGDVETNPGPLAPLARGPNLEKVRRTERLTDRWRIGHLDAQTVSMIDRRINRID